MDYETMQQVRDFQQLVGRVTAWAKEHELTPIFGLELHSLLQGAKEARFYTRGKTLAEMERELERRGWVKTVWGSIEERFICPGLLGAHIQLSDALAGCLTVVLRQNLILEPQQRVLTAMAHPSLSVSVLRKKALDAANWERKNGQVSVFAGKLRK